MTSPAKNLAFVNLNDIKESSYCLKQLIPSTGPSLIPLGDQILTHYED